MLTSHQRNYVRNDLIETLAKSDVDASEQVMLVDTVLAHPELQFIFSFADQPLVSYVDRYGGFVYDANGAEVASARRGEGFDGIPGDGHDFGVHGHAYRVTPHHVFHLVYDHESSDNYVTHDGDLLDLEDTNDWYIVLVADEEPALEL